MGGARLGRGYTGPLYVLGCTGASVRRCVGASVRRVCCVLVSAGWVGWKRFFGTGLGSWDSACVNILSSVLRMYLSAIIVLLFVAYCPVVRADVPPPEETACKGVVAGGACSGGTCADSTCQRADYAHWDRDATAAPPSTSYACVKCVPGTAAADGGSKAKDKDDSGCSLASGTGAGALSFAALVALSALVATRRRRLR
jgi:hypothetical protein